MAITTNGTTNGVNGHTNGTVPHGDVEATINYYLDPSLGGITHYTPGSAGVYRRKFDPHTTTIHDIRDHEADFNIHKQSFQVSPFTTTCQEFTDEEIKKIMYDEAQEFLKKV
jgi:hypothetical protein